MSAEIGRVARSGLIAALLTCTIISPVAADPPEPRTADQPDSWLVLYNTALPESITWAQWYKQQRGIPDGNMVGLDASLDEHLSNLESVQTQIIGPVRALLDDDPDLESRIMGILLGYGLPGTYATPPGSGPGGLSVADALSDMYDDNLPPLHQKGTNPDSPQLYGQMIPDQRLTKETMTPGHYMVARIDAPTPADAMAITARAQQFADPDYYLSGQNVWFDYLDSAFPSGEWYWLRVGVEDPELADTPWTEFDADTDQTPFDAIRFGATDVAGWNDGRLIAPETGGRLLAYNFNSWGVTTARSIYVQGGRYVPNAIYAGYAAAIGATGEPLCCVGPFPETVLAALREGWTLGEAFYLGNPFDDWMWTLVGDPLLFVANWFDVPGDPSPGDGDVNLDGVVDGRDIPPFIAVLTGLIDEQAQLAAADLDGNGAVDDDDAFLFAVPLLYNNYDWDVLKGSGDANGDAHLNAKDVDSFISMLVYGTQGESLRQRWGADMNKDDQLTSDDTPLFIDAILLAP